MKGVELDKLLALLDISINILDANPNKGFTLSIRQKNRLKPHAEFVRRLSKVRSEKGIRRLVQKGSGPAFAALIIPVLAEIARTIIANQRNE